MKKTYQNFLFYWGPVFIYCLLIFIQSSYPSAADARQSPHADKLLHFLAYALLSVLFFRAFETGPFREDTDTVMILAMVSAALYGISDEIHQYYVPSRDADLMDILANILGSIYGAFFYHLFVVRYRIVPGLARLKYLYKNRKIYLQHATDHKSL
jgi:VanZ family protein